jgi:hypothetical protein
VIPSSALCAMLMPKAIIIFLMWLKKVVQDYFECLLHKHPETFDLMPKAFILIIKMLLILSWPCKLSYEFVFARNMLFTAEAVSNAVLLELFTLILNRIQMHKA